MEAALGAVHLEGIFGNPRKHLELHLHGKSDEDLGRNLVIPGHLSATSRPPLVVHPTKPSTHFAPDPWLRHVFARDSEVQEHEPLSGGTESDALFAVFKEHLSNVPAYCSLLSSEVS
ncbi:hypothetical protein J7T55_000459 [Diaporthe amygdali]|uniref:uncharacterized protein n=1 Tax=Phomopsis amygdali TaxID=1214568 RepID=UPI0022FED8BF|nr:uncharacterized protein J7T55_000459 [Diaporthe amygdali]KAJ0103832.1 hypothetical protein J7T55_000459 [Diaporthe amygdali]